jgi:hypothetical protein
MTEVKSEGITCSVGDRMAVESLVKEMIAQHGQCRCIEVGTWLGHTALGMWDAGASVVHCVDTWEGTEDERDGCNAIAKEVGFLRIWNSFCHRVGPERLNKTIVPHCGKSLDWATVWAEPVELIFIDADHRYESVLADIKAWTPHVVPGGILCGHDFGYFPAVERAVRETGEFTVLNCQVWVRRIA